MRLESYLIVLHDKLVNYTHSYQLTDDLTLTELIEYVITWYHLKDLLLILSVPLWLVSHFSS